MKKEKIERRKIDVEKLNDYKERGFLYNQTQGDLTIWNYTNEAQYEGFWDEITLMCRGLVTSAAGEIVAHPFNKFFNHSEQFAPKNFTPTKSYAKLDGSLIIAFYYNWEWYVVSRGSFTSDQAIIARQLFKDLPYERLDIEKTYMFELIGPSNPHVVDYKEDRLILTGVRDVISGVESEPFVKGFNNVKEDGFTNVPFILQAYEHRSGKEMEGFVLVDEDYRRIKVKLDDYIRLHKIVFGLSNKLVWESLAFNTPLEYPDEAKDVVEECKDELNKRFGEILTNATKNVEYIKNGEFETRKEIAKYILNNFEKSEQSLIFGILDGKDVSDMIWKQLKPTKFKRL